jgi:exodeoxyribonuclease V alpha subunit
MMLRNDYERGLFNGDQGLILNVATSTKPARPMAVFPRKEGYATSELNTLAPDITVSFALTVHKSQGSEFDYVSLILPDKDLPLLTREILYTATTRSRRSVVILGSRKLLGAAVERQIRRSSCIAAKLQSPTPHARPKSD